MTAMNRRTKVAATEPSAAPVAYSYIRFSSRKQEEGDSIRRQDTGAKGWAGRNNVPLDTSLKIDKGISAFRGKNADLGSLGEFIRMVDQGRVAKGSYLVVESLDRISRNEVQEALLLILSLLKKGIRIVQLTPVEMVYDSKSDTTALIIMIVEISRGNSESAVKSKRLGDAWEEKRKLARESGTPLTRRLPSWVKLEGGKLVAIPEKAAVVRRIYQLAGGGYGTLRIVAKLNKEGVAPISKGAKWSKAYIEKILGDRRALGEYQPCRGDGTPEGDPIPDYYPAVVTEEEYYRAKAGMKERRSNPGRIGTSRVNVFARLITNARDGDPYFMSRRVGDGRRHYHVLTNTDGEQGRGARRSFPYDTFERAILSRLAEIDPREIVGGDNSAVEAAALEGELATVEAKIAELEAELLNGSVASLARVLRQLEERKSAIASKLDEAKAKAATPVTEAWGAAKSLLGVLDKTKDEEGTRLRLRSAFRRVVERIWLLVVPHKLNRVAAVQVYFTGGSHRDYLIYHKPPHVISGRRKEGGWWVRSLKSAVMENDLDLRKREDAARLEQLLSSIDPASVG
jgi:DNA invertase Pin-like site-specific DNA recombinase